MHVTLRSSCPRIKLAYLVQEDALPPYGNFLLHRCHLMIMNLFIDAAAALLLVTIVLDMISTSCY